MNEMTDYISFSENKDFIYPASVKAVLMTP